MPRLLPSPPQAPSSGPAAGSDILQRRRRLLAGASLDQQGNPLSFNDSGSISRTAPGARTRAVMS